MSGLEKFQASEAWRSNFKKFLFMERKPEIVQNATITKSQRYSLDIDEDLKSIIEQKKKQKAVENDSKKDHGDPSNMATKTDEQSKTESVKNINERENMYRYDESVYGEVSMWQKTSDESFETLEKMCEKTVSDPNSTLFKYLNAEEDQKRNKVVVWQKTSDESFEALERMCDKTASDPNSTLFKYLHTDRKEEILAEVKKRSTDGQSSTTDAEDQLLSKINNCTLLDDIEAPSRMWENTVCGETILQTSPVKMVGLLRPSTIIEEAPDDSANSEISSHFSFRTAAKSDVSTSVYETADDSTAASNKTDPSNKFRIEESKIIDVEQDILVISDQLDEENSPSLDLLENTFVEPSTLNQKPDAESNFQRSNVSIDLIDLEKTLDPAHGSPQALPVDEGGDQDLENKSDSYNALDESVIEILSDDEYDGTTSDIDVYNTNVKTEPISNTTTDANSDTYSLNESKQDDTDNSVENPDQLQKSMQFNDTMEEVEYLLKRGMEYMAAEAAGKQSPEKINVAVSASNIKQTKTQPIAPLKQFKSAKPTPCSSAAKPKPSLYITSAKKTPLVKGSASASKRFDMEIRPFPKFDIFAKPAAQTRTKELASKQQKFSHIVSPIGTYMKKTAQTPLLSSINCKTKDYFNSTAIIELENESRLYKPHFQTTSHEKERDGFPKLPGLVIDAKRPLPKKAYISSDLKHIVDERTPITIPASKKIQKYLENAMMPAVLRHEGKFKVPDGISNKLHTSTTSSGSPSFKLPLKESNTNSEKSVKPTTSGIPRRNNASLADLSVMSGDVSMYTIMDAQKF